MKSKLQREDSEGVVTAMSTAREPEAVAQDLARQLIHPHLGFVLFFCSAEYDLDVLGPTLEQYFGGVGLVGCTSAGEITPLGYGRNCVTAVGFDHRSFSIASALIDELERFSLIDAQQLVERLVSDCRNNALAPIKNHCFALTLLDGLSSREEVVLAALSAALGSIPHFGGSAGDDNHLNRTHVYYGGAFHAGAAVVVLVNTWLDFEVFSTHHVVPSNEKLVVTQADSPNRRVLELNAEPAAQEYARLIGVPLEALDVGLFAAHPLAVRINENYYVRSIQRVNQDLSLTFYCAVENGIVLTAMTPGPLVPNLQTLFQRLNERLGPPLLTIGCDCFLRRLEVERTDVAAETSAFLQRQRVIGFNSYGEQFNGMHINQTFTGVAIGRSAGAENRAAAGAGSDATE
ncbi:nitric oxide-sensing protein NosP [Pseudomonas sp. 2FE]|uniref:nitric oxide-sensing protein NosP n=1 Tax=Pseudomonas sp. 2FE TaxID=2502190 RepID=UPI0010FA0523|nr:nitric oxide-sensing protein NosP [Pseudomonas sp. 2FE]